MAKTLASYIKEQLDKGYDINTIKYNLMKYGYNTSQINQAIDEMHNPREVRHIIHLSPTTMITLVAVFLSLVVLSSIFFFVLKEKEPAQLLDIELKGVTTTAKQGSEISFITKLSSLGSKKRFDVNLKHEVISKKTNKILTFEEETKAIETSASLQKEIKIPEDALPGDYILRAIAAYNNKKAVAILPVKVEKAEALPVPQEPEMPQENETIEETCYDNIKNQDEEDIDCGGVCEPCEEEEQETLPETSIDISELSSYDALEKIKEIAKQNPTDAASYCPKFEFQTSRDLCYEYVGEQSGDKRYCEKVQDERTKYICYANVAIKLFKPELCEAIKDDYMRDKCYIAFVIGDKKDFSVCDKIINEYVIKQCNILKQLRDTNATQLTFYESLIMENLVQMMS